MHSSTTPILTIYSVLICRPIGSGTIGWTVSRIALWDSIASKGAWKQGRVKEFMLCKILMSRTSRWNFGNIVRLYRISSTGKGSSTTKSNNKKFKDITHRKKYCHRNWPCSRNRKRRKGRHLKRSRRRIRRYRRRIRSCNRLASNKDN